MSSIFQTFFLFTQEDWRRRYPSAYALIGEATGLLLSLTVYWYTSRAFGTAGISEYLNGLAPNYFSYIILSEVTLIIPLSLMNAVLEFTRLSREEGTLDELLLLSPHPVSLFVGLSVTGIPRETVRATLTLVLAALVFNFHVTLPAFMGWLVIQGAALAAFAGIGMIAAGFFLIFGRGQGALTLITMVGTILGGAYFPQQLLPALAQKFSNLLSPFQILLQAPRQLFLTGWTNETTQCLLGLIVWGAVLFPIGAIVLYYGFYIVRRRGSAEIFST
ncbi:MAG: ABC transporter permease [Bdellovibrionota bacterium]